MRTVFFAFTLSTALSAGALACGSSSQSSGSQATPEGGAGDDAAAQPETGPVDAGPDVDFGAPSSTYPAPHPPLPTLTNQGGNVLASPKLYLIFYKGYDYEAEVQDLAQKLGASSYWSAATKEYGVGPIAYAGSTELTDTPPMTITNTDVGNFIAAKVASGAFGTPDPETIYSIFYPKTTTITMTSPLGGGTSQSCMSFGGYHEDTIITPDAGPSIDIAYAVVPECPNFGTRLSGVDAVTGPASHEWAEASTDPHPSSNNGANAAYATVDQPHFIWGLALGGGEDGDLCAQDPMAFFKPQDIGATVQRTWSNQLAVADHDPCAPDLPNMPYFNSGAVLNADVSIAVLGLQTKGVRVPQGQSGTVEVDLFSEAATSGPWTVKAVDALATLQKGSPPSMTFSWVGNKNSGVNGEKLYLQITVIKATQFGVGAFLLESALPDGQVHFWPGLVQQN
jgi:hypothetical protein